MNKKSAPRAAAVIEIGSNNVRMRVSQWAKGTVATLDRLEYPVSLGHDVFSSGDISFDSLRELSSVLSKFTAALRSYNIEKPKVISCTALREAKNRALVVDQLKVRNGLEVTVLEDSQEKAYIYKEVMERLDGAKLHPGNTMIAYVGSGSIGVAVYDGQKIIYTQNISMGALKLHDVLRHTRSRVGRRFLLYHRGVPGHHPQPHCHLPVPGEEPGAHRLPAGAGGPAVRGQKGGYPLSNQREEADFPVPVHPLGHGGKHCQPL